MKLTTKILLILLLLFTSGLFASNMLLKQEYLKIDKTDIYWTYSKILEQPFKHLKIEGGNISNIAYEQSKTASVRVFKDWRAFDEHSIKAQVANDTLYINFPNTYHDLYEKEWLKWNVTVRLFSPELLSVTGSNTNFEMYKVKQKNLSVNISGKSKFEVESMDTNFDSLRITQSDSSAVVFEMSPEYKKSESFHVHYVNASVRGASVLDIGHAQVDSLQLSVSDSSGVLLSGGTMKKNQRYNFNSPHQ
jgi:Putative auto-transporter adhesin, head GIN domain